MALLTRYDTPAFLPDFNAIPGQLDAWHRAVSAWFDQIIANDRSAFGDFSLQYYNAATFDPGGVVVEQAITWNAFPKELIRRYGRERALVLADRLWPIERYGSPSADPDDTTGTLGVLYRPQEEYCEWHGCSIARKHHRVPLVLRKRNGEAAFTTADVVFDLENDSDLVATLPEDLSADWSKKNNGVSFVRRLGKAFSAREGRRHGEMEARIERVGEARNAVKWRVLINIPARLLQFMPAEPGPVAESRRKKSKNCKKW